MMLKCKVCGGDIQITEKSPFGICKYCGSAMTLPKTSDEQRIARYNRGNQFRRGGKFDEALAQYEQLVQEDDTDAEAHWCCALCRFGIDYVEDPETLEYIPTCHRLSFESFLNDVDYQAALANSDGFAYRQYQKEAKRIAEVQKGILTTSQNEEPFDVFICYKESDDNGQRTRDSLLAQDIYYQLMEHGYRTFYSRITLEGKAGTEYEPYIFAALNSAKVMVVVTTSKDHVDAAWVKNEWSRYLSLMRKDHSKLLLPCYRDMDPYDLPDALSVLQSYDMSKIGFIQDLIRGIKKVIDGTSDASGKSGIQGTDALLKRAFIFLEDGEWENARNHLERILDQDPENGDAYLGRLMCELQVRKKENLKDQRVSFSNRASYHRAMKYGNQSIKTLLQTAENSAVSNEKRDKIKAAYQGAVATLAKAYLLEKEKDYRGAMVSYQEAGDRFAALKDYKDATAKKEECAVSAKRVREQDEEAGRERTYQSAKKEWHMAESSSNYITVKNGLEKAIRQFEQLSGWKDSSALAEEYKVKLKEVNEAERIRAKEEQIQNLTNEKKHLGLEEKKLELQLSRDKKLHEDQLKPIREEIKIHEKVIAELQRYRVFQKAGAILLGIGTIAAMFGDLGLLPAIISIPTGVIMLIMATKKYRDKKTSADESQKSISMNQQTLSMRISEFETQEQEILKRIAYAAEEQAKLNSEIERLTTDETTVRLCNNCGAPLFVFANESAKCPYCDRELDK